MCHITHLIVVVVEFHRLMHYRWFCKTWFTTPIVSIYLCIQLDIHLFVQNRANKKRITRWLEVTHLCEKVLGYSCSQNKSHIAQLVRCSDGTPIP